MVMSPENPSSDMGSEYDDVDYVDDHESEGGGDDDMNFPDINFAGVTSDLEVRKTQKRERGVMFFIVFQLTGEAVEKYRTAYNGTEKSCNFRGIRFFHTFFRCRRLRLMAMGVTCGS